MASFARPSILRQGVLSAPSKRIFSTSLPICRSPPTIYLRPTSAIFSKKPSTPNNTRNGLIASRVAHFHSSARRDILPPGPQVIKGTVNDPAPVPPPSPTHGSYHWTFERAVSVALIPLTIAPFAAGSLHPVTDALFVAAILVHSHIGFQACIIDYFPTWQVPTVRKLLSWLLNIVTVMVGVGFYEFETNDVGLTEGIKRIWKA